MIFNVPEPMLKNPAAIATLKNLANWGDLPVANYLKRCAPKCGATVPIDLPLGSEDFAAFDDDECWIEDEQAIEDEATPEVPILDPVEETPEEYKRRINRERYDRIKADPVLYAAHRAKQAAAQNRRYHAARGGKG